MPVWIPALWLLSAMGVLAFRWRWLGMLPRRDDLSLQTRLRLAVGLSLLNGLAHGASLAAFPVLTEAERAFFTVLLLGLCTGAVGTAARPPFSFHRLYPAGAGPIDRVVGMESAGSDDPSWVERSIALLIGLYFLILLGLAREAWKRFLESVRIRYQERSLQSQVASSLAARKRGQTWPRPAFLPRPATISGSRCIRSASWSPRSPCGPPINATRKSSTSWDRSPWPCPRNSMDFWTFQNSTPAWLLPKTRSSILTSFCASTTPNSMPRLMPRVCRRI